jgi:hypothetical protein
MNQPLPKTEIDHIIYATRDLQVTIDALERLVGVRPAIGGQHPGRGTHNALLSLGPGVYLEIIGPDPLQPDPEKARSFGIDQLSGPRLVTWAARPASLDDVVQSARAAGYDPGEIQVGGRDRPDGVHLAWRSSIRPEKERGRLGPGDGLVPFLIEWGDTSHPSQAAPSGCRLLSLQGKHPEAAAINELLATLGVDFHVTEATEVALVATLATPNGEITLS